MTDTPKTSDTSVTAAPDAPTSPPKVPADSPPPVGDPEVTTTPVLSEKPHAAPAPLKI